MNSNQGPHNPSQFERYVVCVAHSHIDFKCEACVDHLVKPLPETALSIARRGVLTSEYGACVTPSNARRPVSISCSTHPRAISARASAALPSSCSGAMYAGVPTTTPGRVTTGMVACAS